MALPREAGVMPTDVKSLYNSMAFLLKISFGLLISRSRERRSSVIELYEHDAACWEYALYARKLLSLFATKQHIKRGEGRTYMYTVRTYLGKSMDWSIPVLIPEALDFWNRIQW